MNSEMKKYYCEIGGAPHRFDAINLYAAQQTAKLRAEVVNMAVWTVPVRYDEQEHDRHFDRWQQ